MAADPAALDPAVVVLAGGKPVSIHRRSSSRVTEELLDVNAKYIIDDKEIGHGHYGVVRKCRCREAGVDYAIKTIKKGKVGSGSSNSYLCCRS
jgi:hypothetical protein